VGTFVFHPAHDHWHFENFARYELHNLSADGSVGGNVYASADKVSFCLIDEVSFLPKPRSLPAYSGCNQIQPQGISVGWVDVYPSSLPDQNLDVTRIPEGDYWLVSTADPDNLINEGGGPSENNNTAAVRVHIGRDIVWLDDSLPELATSGASGGDSWKWISRDPAPFSGKLAHVSAASAGVHGHFFNDGTATRVINTNDSLFTYVYLDPANLPSEVMVQWADSNWEHRAYWGRNDIPLGADGTVSRRFVGPLPPAGQWVRLEVAAREVGLEGSMLAGMYFTLHDGRAAWDYSGVASAPSEGIRPSDVKNVPPVLRSYSGSAYGITFELTDGTTKVEADSIRLTFDGTAAIPFIRKSAAATSINYDAAALLASGSSHSVGLEFSDSATPSEIQSYHLDFVVPVYLFVPAEFATASGEVDQKKPGFKIRPYQTQADNPSSLAWTEDQLAGLKGPNLANLSGADRDGYYSRESVVNFAIGGEAGNFPNDDPVPGFPGAGLRDGGTGNSSLEVLTFLEFPVPGFYLMGVNSDDVFRVTTGANPLDRFSVKLGDVDGVSHPVEQLVTLLVPKAAIYPFRLVWGNAGGKANLEWFTLNNGTKVLVNDRHTPGSVKAFRDGSARPYVKTVSPSPGTADVSATNGIRITLVDGDPLQVATGSIQLFLNAQPVQPVVNRNGSITTVTYTPPVKFAPASTNTVRLVYADSASPPYRTTNEFTFIVAPDIDVLIGPNSTQVWRYNQSAFDFGIGWTDPNFNDADWPSGAALFEGRIGTLPELPEPVRTTLTTSSTIITHYFRTHFSFTGNPGAARLSMRCVIDDGAVFYLNGAEIYRVGMPAGPITATTLAVRDVDDAGYEGPFELPVRGLVQGDNVLAVEVHQNSPISLDVTMAVQLLLIASNPVRTRIDSIIPAPEALDVPQDTPIEIVLLDGTRKVRPESIRLFVNGQSVRPTVSQPAGGASTKIYYRPDRILPPESTTAVKLEFSDDATLPELTIREFRFTTQPDITMLVPTDGSLAWRYDDSGADRGTAWKEKSFDDIAWKSGLPLFAGMIGMVSSFSDPIRTILTVAPNRTNFYFRTHFNFSGNPATAKLKMKCLIDDGAVFYLNGTEIYRQDMPPGPIAASTFAARTVEDARYEGPFDIPANSLVAGDNVLAVEVHQDSPSSLDVALGVQMFVPGSSFPPASAFTNVGLVGSNLRIEWVGSAQLLSAEAVTGPWTEVTNASSPFIVARDRAMKFFRLMP